jgi:GNAT superfamily N-acetyltransferase
MMTEPIVVEMMPRDAILWRCLHGGPLTTDSIEQWAQNGSIPWAEFRARNIPFLMNLMDTYGACAVVARIGGLFIGHLRFYPKAVWALVEPSLGMCLQQEFPYGPAEALGRRRFPPLEEVEDKTLVVHCMMLSSGGLGGESYRRKGVGAQMARTLIDWATENGWHSIESTAYEGLPIIYATTGQAGRTFWENLGFRLIRKDHEPALEEETDFVRKMREEARAQRLDPATIKNKYIMRLALR